MEYSGKKHFLVFLTGLALVFCFISLPRLNQDRSEEFGDQLHQRLSFLPNLTSEECQFIHSHHRLVILEGLITANGTVVMATNDSAFTSRYGRFQVLHMEEAESGDYIKFVYEDEVRALHRLNYEELQLRNLFLRIVRKSPDFERKWRNSRFIECLGLEVSNATRVIPESFIDDLTVFRNFVEDYDSSLFLFGGTLLGWYRECSFIRDTTDIDFAMKIEELNGSFLNGLRRTTLFDLFWILGKKEDSMELSVYSNKIKIDLFFLYRDEQNDWVGGMNVPEKKKLRWVYPHIDSLCTGDLLGRLFNVPCDVEPVLEADYGTNWTIPHSTATFIWYKSHNNVRPAGFWKKSDWKYVYRTFPPHKRPNASNVASVTLSR